MLSLRLPWEKSRWRCSIGKQVDRCEAQKNVWVCDIVKMNDIKSSILSLLNLMINVKAIRWLSKVMAQFKPGLYSFCDDIKTNLMDMDGIMSVTKTF